MDPLVREFARFILSKEGQEVVVKDGYLPQLRSCWQEGPILYEQTTILDTLTGKLDNMAITRLVKDMAAAKPAQPAVVA